MLAGAKTTEKAAVRDLYTLGYLGPFKEAGTLVGTSKVYTLEGGSSRSVREQRVRPSWWRRPSTSGVSTTRRNSRWRCSLAYRGYRDFKAGETEPISIAGLNGFELNAEAIDTDDNVPVQLYQALLVGKDGGYFRLIGIATDADKAPLQSEFARIARSFTLLP